MASKDIQPRDVPYFKCFPFNPLPLHPHPPTTQLLLGSHELTLLPTTYLYFEPTTSKTYVSRHVQFVESIFPYTTLNIQQPRLTTTIVSDWIPPVITIPSPSPAQSPSYTLEVQAPDLAPVVDHISKTFPPPHQPGPTSQPELASQQVSTPAPRHSMTTRAKNHITKPIQKLNLHTHLASSPSSEPTSVAQALKDSN